MKKNKRLIKEYIKLLENLKKKPEKVDAGELLQSYNYLLTESVYMPESI